jgi:hypothetical protein
MNWEMIGATGEWAGSLAVVVTLFYLARQIRTSTNQANTRERFSRSGWHAWRERVLVNRLWYLSRVFCKVHQ